MKGAILLTFDETLNYLKRVDAVFPTPTEKQTDEALIIKAEIWTEVLKGITYKQAVEALNYYCACNTSGFAPQPAHILNFCRQKNRLTDGEIEVYLRRALCDSTYHADEQFERLPDDLKRLVGSAAELKRQAMREQDDTQIYIKKICKEYRSRVDSGTLDNTLLISAGEKQRIGETMKKLEAGEC